MHVLTLTGTGTPGFSVAKLQHSADGITWADLTTGTNAFNGGSAITAVGGYTAFVPFGTTINPYIRSVVTTQGTTISTTFGISAARQ
jgi:hypothetical protein